MSVINNVELKNDLELLVENGNWPALRCFFSTWGNHEERIDKIFLFGHFFLDHYLRDESPLFHRDLIRSFFSPHNEYTAAPRGFSKTTCIQLCIIFSICNQLDKFIVMVEKTFNEAAEVLNGVRAEFVDNKKILMVYGNLFENLETKILEKMAKNADSKGDLFINGVRLRAKGFNSSIRGLKSREWRPTRIVLDDVEDDEHIDNPDQRKKYIDNYNKGIQPAVDITGCIKMYGTILHQDSLLKNLVEIHEGKIFRAYDPKNPRGTLLWPERWSFEMLEAKKKSMMDSGMSSNAFAQEYLNDPIGDDDRTFHYDWLFEHIKDPNNLGSSYRVPARRISMDEFNELRKTTTLNGYGMIDVADVTTAGADFTGVTVVFIDMHNNRYIVDVRREKRNVKQVIDLIFEIWNEWVSFGLITIGIEKKGFSDQILPMFEEEKRKRGIYPIITELKPMGRNKENRIKGALQGFFETGKFVCVGRIGSDGIFRPVGDTMDLLEELYTFPASKKDDLSDSLSYIADIGLVPFGDENKEVYHIEPQDDPFEYKRDMSEFMDLDPFL